MGLIYLIIAYYDISFVLTLNKHSLKNLNLFDIKFYVNNFTLFLLALLFTDPGGGARWLWGGEGRPCEGLHQSLDEVEGPAALAQEVVGLKTPDHHTGQSIGLSVGRLCTTKYITR